jgi:hypothetical protein
MSKTTNLVFIAGIALASNAGAALAQDHHPMEHEHAPPAVAEDARQLVEFPAPLFEHELANMRDHLRTLSQIQAALAQYDFDRAADLAEKRLGMSSFGLHGAHEVAPYMPKGMQEAGTAMHHAASRFAIATQKAAIDHDVAGALGALNEVTQSCLACHAAYRLR